MPLLEKWEEQAENGAISFTVAEYLHNPELHEYLEQHPEIDKVRVDYENSRSTNNMGFLDAHGLLSFLLHRPTSFLNLNSIHHGMWAPIIEKVAVAELADGLATNTSLKTLIIKNSQIDNQDMGAICAAIYTNKLCKIEYINLSNNSIGKAGVESLVNLLRVNRSLKYLDISDNEISDAGINILFEALEHNESLQEICLDFNKFKNFNALAKLIECNPFGPRVKFELDDMPNILGSIPVRDQDNIANIISRVMEALLTKAQRAIEEFWNSTNILAFVDLNVVSCDIQQTIKGLEFTLDEEKSLELLRKYEEPIAEILNSKPYLAAKALNTDTTAGVSLYLRNSIFWQKTNPRLHDEQIFSLIR